MRSEGRAAQAPIFLLVTKAREGAQEGGYAVTWASSPRLPAGLLEAEKGQTPEVSSKEVVLCREEIIRAACFGLGLKPVKVRPAVLSAGTMRPRRRLVTPCPGGPGMGVWRLGQRGPACWKFKESLSLSEDGTRRKGAGAWGRRCLEGISSVGCEVSMISKHRGDSPALTSREPRTLGAQQTRAPLGSHAG